MMMSVLHNYYFDNPTKLFSDFVSS